MKYLITGGAGFIGSHLSEDLIKRGDSVIVVDNLSTGKNEINPSVQFIQGSIFDENLMDNMVTDRRLLQNFILVSYFIKKVVKIFWLIYS